MATMAKPPFAKWSDTDHAAPILVVTVLTFLYWVVPGIAQSVVSWNQYGDFTSADFLYIASMVFGAAQSITLLIACSYGFGKSATILQMSNVVTAERIYHASNVLYLLVLGLSKCSAACSVVTLTVPNRGKIRNAPAKQKLVFAVVIVVSVVWTIASIATLAAQCVPRDQMSVHANSCEGTMATWIGIFVGDAITDFAIIAFAGNIIWSTRALARLKIVWYIPFIIRLCAIILAGVRLTSINQTILANDSTLNIWLFAVLTQIQIFLSLIAAGFPALKKTVFDMVTNYGVAEDTRSRSRSGPSYIMSKLSKKKSSNRSRESQYAHSLPFAGSSLGNAVVVHGKPKTPNDDDSQRGILRHDEYDVIVSHEPPELRHFHQ